MIRTPPGPDTAASAASLSRARRRLDGKDASGSLAVTGNATPATHTSRSQPDVTVRIEDAHPRR